MTHQNGSGPKQIGDALGQSLARLQVNIEARHRKRVEAEARPGETFEQAETRLRAEDGAREQEEAQAQASSSPQRRGRRQGTCRQARALIGAQAASR